MATASSKVSADPSSYFSVSSEITFFCRAMLLLPEF
jgi:hypothetical protein